MSTREGSAVRDDHQDGLARVGGDLALDFANTVSFRGTSRERDWLGDLDKLFDWAGQAETARLPAEVGDAPGLLAEAHGLRAAIYSLGSDLAAGRGPGHDALDVIRRTAADALASGRIGRGDGAFGLAFDRGGARAAVLGPVAWAALDLLRSDRLGRLKQCPACDCRWLFLDATKNGRRRWCDMATCGNRAKATRFRLRA